MAIYHTYRMFKVNTTYMKNADNQFAVMQANKYDIGARLEEARKAAGFSSREKVSKRLGRGFSVAAIQKHEDGTNELKPNVAVRYAQLYKADLIWLLTGEGEMKGDFGPELDQTILEEAIFSAVAGVKALRSSTDEEVQDLVDAATKAYERLKARNERKTA